MANWKEVTERWLPIVEHMEEHDMDDYAIPEIYRAAEKAIEELVESLDHALEHFGFDTRDVIKQAINQHKGD